MTIKNSDRINQAVAKLYEGHDTVEVDDALYEEADATCTTGYDNDGSTGYEIFSNGYRLGLAAAGREAWEVCDGGSPPTAYFFLGTEDEVLARLAGLSFGSDDAE